MACICTRRASEAAVSLLGKRAEEQHSQNRLQAGGNSTWLRAAALRCLLPSLRRAARVRGAARPCTPVLWRGRAATPRQGGQRLATPLSLMSFMISSLDQQATGLFLPTCALYPGSQKPCCWRVPDRVRSGATARKQAPERPRGSFVHCGEACCALLTARRLLCGPSQSKFDRPQAPLLGRQQAAAARGAVALRGRHGRGPGRRGGGRNAGPNGAPLAPGRVSQQGGCTEALPHQP
jgi:hypothetical protein